MFLNLGWSGTLVSTRCGMQAVIVLVSMVVVEDGRVSKASLALWVCCLVERRAEVMHGNGTKLE